MQRFANPILILKIAPVTLIVCAVIDSHFAGATIYCENIDGERVAVGELRYDTNDGDDSCYVNAYADGGDELSIPSGNIIGGAATTATNLGFIAAVYDVDDSDSDCSNVTFQMVMKRSDTQSGLCPSGFTSVTDTYVVNSCENSLNADHYYASTIRLGRANQSFKQWWQFDLSVNTGTGCSSSDSGCAQVAPPSGGSGITCTLDDF